MGGDDPRKESPPNRPKIRVFRAGAPGTFPPASIPMTPSIINLLTVRVLEMLICFQRYLIKARCETFTTSYSSHYKYK